MTSLKEYFRLTKDEFDIDPERDADVYFGYNPLEERILERLASDFVQARHVPKFFMHAPYGGGKTHTLCHIRYVLNNDADFKADFPATLPILTEVPPLKKRESWRKIHELLMNEIGRGLIKEAVQGVIAGRGGFAGDVPAALHDAGALRFGDTSLRNSQAQIFRNLLFGGVQETISWEWLKGKDLTLDQASTLNTETNLSETADLVAALLNVAALVWAGLQKKLVILLDEAEMMRSVDHPDSHQEFIWAIRRLVSNDNDVLGLIVGYQMEGGNESAPPMFSNPAVLTRIGGASGDIDLTELVAEPGDVKGFILDVLRRLVDQTAAKQLIDDDSLPTEPEFFPFTEEAVDRITDAISTDPERKNPRGIKNVLSEAVSQAWLRGRKSPTMQLVDVDLAEEVLFPDSI